MKIEKKTILAIVLGVVALGVVMHQIAGVFSFYTKAITSAVAAPTPAPAVPGPEAVTESVEAASILRPTIDYEGFIATVRETDLDYGSRGFRNPMTPLISGDEREKTKTAGPAAKVAVGPTDALSLGYAIEGIVWNEVDPLALINEQVVSIGESLSDGSLITEITQDTVRFNKSGRDYFLVFKEE